MDNRTVGASPERAVQYERHETSVKDEHTEFYGVWRKVVNDGILERCSVDEQNLLIRAYFDDLQ